MKPLSFGINHQRQFINIGILQFDKLAVFENQRHYFMLAGQLFEYVGIGAALGLALPDALQAEAVKQDFAKLFGRVDIKRQSRDSEIFYRSIRESAY